MFPYLLRMPKCPLLRPELYLLEGPITQSQVKSLLPYLLRTKKCVL